MNLINLANDTNQLIRSDKRCGSSFALTNGSLTECDPYSIYYCCSEHGYCGDTSEHCECPNCIDYRKKYSLNNTILTKLGYQKGENFLELIEGYDKMELRINSLYKTEYFFSQ